jgi:hypothetical protein
MITLHHDNARVRDNCVAKDDILTQYITCSKAHGDATSWSLPRGILWIKLYVRNLCYHSMPYLAFRISSSVSSVNGCKPFSLRALSLI